MKGSRLSNLIIVPAPNKNGTPRKKNLKTNKRTGMFIWKSSVSSKVSYCFTE